MSQYDCVIIEATDYFLPGQLLGFEIYDYTFCFLVDKDIKLGYVKEDFEKRTGLCVDMIYIVEPDTDAYKTEIKLDDGRKYITPCIKIDGIEVSITGFYLKDM